jgi:hypothetical protein
MIFQKSLTNHTKTYFGCPEQQKDQKQAKQAVTQ